MQPTKDLPWFNSLSSAHAAQELLKCCGSKRWAQELANGRPYPTLQTLIAKANDIWRSLEPSDWLEAFRSHPKIGEKRAAVSVSEQSQNWSAQEQAGVSKASRETIDSLATLNQSYAEKFGYIFIICATGKTSDEMLLALRGRLQNDSRTELRVAAAEQAKITELRLNKLLTSS
jgi:OHCU decarboxylase